MTKLYKNEGSEGSLTLRLGNPQFKSKSRSCGWFLWKNLFNVWKIVDVFVETLWNLWGKES